MRTIDQARRNQAALFQTLQQTHKDQMRERQRSRSATQIAITAIGLVLSITAAEAQTVHVSTHGQDKASGTAASPVATIARAVFMARHTREHRVEIDGGTYILSAPLQLTAADSGLALTAAAGQHVTLSGGVRVAGWKLVDQQRSLWSAKLPAGAPIPRQIYIGGVRASRAKGRAPVGLTMTDGGYTADSDVLAHWKHPDELEFVYTGGNALWSEPEVGLGAWTEPRCPVAAVHGTTIEMAQPCWDNSTKRIKTPGATRPNNLVGPASVGKQPTYIENAYELLGTPGEFYVDRASRTIFYTPRSGEDLRKADVEVPVLESLLEIKGDEAAPVHDISITGLTFAYAGWQEPSGPEGFSEIQANYRVTGKDGATRQALCTLAPEGTCPYASWTPEHANVETRFADSVQFERDTFTHLGAAGLAITGGAHKNLVEGCVFTDISGNGLELAEVDAPEAADSSFAVANRIENDLFRNVGAEFHGGIPIVVGYARFTHIAHNQIDHVPYAGISMGWGGWPDKIALPGVANRSTGNVIEKNRITRFMLNLADGGGIYTQGRTGVSLADGERIEGNVIDLQFSSGHGIYTDNGSAMITIRHNVVFNTNHDNIASAHKDYYDGLKGDVNDPLAIEENWWQQGDPDSDAKQIVRKGNHLINALDQAPAEILSAAGLEAAYLDLATPPTKAVAPQPPTAVAAFLTPTEAYVTWRPSVFEGGRAVDRYIVRSDDGVETTLSADAFDHVGYAVLKLKPSAASVRFTVAAVNSVGTSAPSLPSLTVARVAVQPVLPGAPDYAAVERQGPRASIHFAAPKDSKDIIAYALTITPDARHEVFTGRRILTLSGAHRTFVTVDGLTPGKHYRFGVSAINAAGEGETLWIDDQRADEGLR